MTTKKPFTKYLLYSCLLVLISCSSGGAKTSYWTKFRGADGLGIDPEGKAPVKWGASDFQWKIPLPGIGNSSPVVWGNTIFVSSADNEKNTGHITAVDGGSGNIFWQMEFQLTGLSMHVNNKLAALTPAVDKSQVYVIWYSTEKTTLIALSHQGTIQWQAEFGGIICRHGGGSSLLLTEEYVVFTREQEDFSTLKSSWVAVHKQSGKTAWELERESAESNSFATPLLIKLDKQKPQLIFASQSHGVTGVDPKTGEVLWEREELLPSRVVGSPILSEGKIILNRKGEVLVIDMDPVTNQAADTALYTLPRKLSPYVPTPISVEGNLFLFTDGGTVACVSLATGELLWKERPAGAIYGSPVCVNGNLYCITKDGEVIVVRAGPTYQLFGISALGEGSYSTPVMCSSGMVFRTFTQLMLLGNNEK